MRRVVLGTALVTLAAGGYACVRVPVGAPRPGGRGEAAGDVSRVSASEREVRIALATAARETRLSAEGGEWWLYGADGRTLLARPAPASSWRIEPYDGGVRAVRADGVPTGGVESRIVARPAPGTLLLVNGKRYRGEVVVSVVRTGPTDALLVVNQLRMDDYLKGVVPLELGTSAMGDLAAMEAQAVAARSYAYTRLGSGRSYDLLATVSDQVYGGAGVETIVGSRAVSNTTGLVLRYGDRVVNAPFSSTCGGSTAEAQEVWRTRGEPYLQRVSDRIPGTERYYCEGSARFRWTTVISRRTLDDAVARYLATYASVPSSGVGRVHGVAVTGRTASGRVATLALTTDRGVYTLRGNDVRYVLRTAGGEILGSTYFSVEQTTGVDGAVERLTVRGGGYGHGVGMCQWGAIGRARAGQNFRDILHAYFPGTTIGFVD